MRRDERSRKRRRLLSRLFLLVVVALFAVFLIVVPIVEGTSPQVGTFILLLVLVVVLWFVTNKIMRGEDVKDYYWTREAL